MGTTTENRITSTQAKDAIYKAHSISSSASEIDAIINSFKPKGNIVFWGDSLTQGNSTVSNVPKILSTLLNTTVRNEGIAGQSSSQIAVRQGAIPLTITLENNTLAKKELYDELCTNRFFENSTGWTLYSGATISNNSCHLLNLGAYANGISRNIPLTLGDKIQIRVKITDYVNGTLTAWLGGQSASTNGNFTIINNETYCILETTVPANYTGSIVFGSANTAIDLKITEVSIKKTNAIVVANITSKSLNILTQAGSYATSQMVTIQDMLCVIKTDASGNWTITRFDAGEAITTNINEVATLVKAIQYKGEYIIIWAGRNDSRSTRANIIATRDNIIAPIKNRGYYVNNYFVLGIINSSTETSSTSEYANIIETNRELKEYFGDRFIDIRDYLVKRAIYDANITPTTQDVTDMANGIIPVSLRYDSLHINLAANQVVSEYIKKKMWID